MAFFQEDLQEYTIRLSGRISTHIIPAPERGMMHTPHRKKEDGAIFLVSSAAGCIITRCQKWMQLYILLMEYAVTMRCIIT